MDKGKKKISVLGCGWLGLPLAAHLVAEGFVVKGAIRTSEKSQLLQSKGVLPFLIDIDEESAIDADFFSTDVLIIAIPSKNRSGFERLIAQISQTTVKKVIFISATSVYDASQDAVKETDKTLDTTLAGIEQLFVKTDNFDTTILRFGGLYGPGRNPGNFFKKGRVIQNPEGVVNMIHQEDCIAIIRKIIATGVANDIFNACADTHPTRREFYTNAKQKLGLDAPDFEEGQPIVLKEICSEKLKRKLKYTFKYADILHS